MCIVLSANYLIDKKNTDITFGYEEWEVWDKGKEVDKRD